MGHEVPVVTSGDGLYEIKHENINNTVNDVGFKKSEYRYAGASPNNYITFNNELWRIIGIVNVMTDTSTVEQRVKIIRDKPLGAFAWDFNEKNDWTQATLMEMLNNGYYNSMSNFTCYIGKNDDTKVVESSICDFSQGDMKGLNKLAQNQIEEVIWNIGGEEFKDGELVIKLYYEKERGTKVYDTQPYLWSKSNSKDGIFHSIAIIYPSDYAYATSGGEKGQDYCLGFVFNSWNLGNAYSPVCIENDWLKNDEGWRWFLFNNTLNDKNIYYSSHLGYVRAVATSKFGYLITPTLYLKTNVKIISGTGSANEAFEIVQVIK